MPPESLIRFSLGRVSSSGSGGFFLRSCLSRGASSLSLRPPSSGHFPPFSHSWSSRHRFRPSSPPPPQEPSPHHLPPRPSQRCSSQPSSPFPSPFPRPFLRSPSSPCGDPFWNKKCGRCTLQPCLQCLTVHFIWSFRMQTLKRSCRSLKTLSGSCTSFCSRRSHKGAWSDPRASSPALTIATTPRAVKRLCERCISSMLVHVFMSAAKASAPSSSMSFL
mmetsp:Transcript_74701/g.242768  ORF Transcript_74701/g.242768 Transcript_74701/m.242768 type:complete len:219 (-) Transcript_74701:377-1033(-)